MEDPADPDVFERDLRKTLEVLRNDVGKVFVNLVELFHVSVGGYLREEGIWP